jgi:NAD(P)H dehydrogenase (quinone)
MYAILGATGQVGGAVVDALRARVPTSSIRVIGRRPPAALAEGVEWRAADLRGDPAVLAEALAGASAMFALSPVEADAPDVFADGARIARTLAEAIVRAGRPRVVALSSQGAHLDDGTGIIRTLHALESALAATGALTSFLRPTLFMQSWLPFVEAALASGRWQAMHAPVDAPQEAVSARDVGTCAAALLLESSAPAIVNVRGAGAWSEQQLAQLAAGLAGREIELTPVAPAQRAQALRNVGLGASYARELAAMHAAIEAGGVPFAPADREYRGIESLEAVLARAFDTTR